MACGEIGPQGSLGFLSRCTVSGTGPLLGSLTGRLSNFEIGITSVFDLQPFFAP